MPWIKKAIQLEKEFYVVYKPTKDSVMADVFSGRPTTLEDLINKAKGGLTSNMVSAIFTDSEEAQEYADGILEILEEKEQKGE